MGFIYNGFFENFGQKNEAQKKARVIGFSQKKNDKIGSNRSKMVPE
jgi:hypothetical protein